MSVIKQLKETTTQPLNSSLRTFPHHHLPLSIAEQCYDINTFNYNDTFCIVTPSLVKLGVYNSFFVNQRKVAPDSDISQFHVLITGLLKHFHLHFFNPTKTKQSHLALTQTVQES